MNNYLFCIYRKTSSAFGIFVSTLVRATFQPCHRFFNVLALRETFVSCPCLLIRSTLCMFVDLVDTLSMSVDQISTLCMFVDPVDTLSISVDQITILCMFVDIIDTLSISVDQISIQCMFVDLVDTLSTSVDQVNMLSTVC